MFNQNDLLLPNAQTTDCVMGTLACTFCTLLVCTCCELSHENNAYKHPARHRFREQLSNNKIWLSLRWAHCFPMVHHSIHNICALQVHRGPQPAPTIDVCTCADPFAGGSLCSVNWNERATVSAGRFLVGFPPFFSWVTFSNARQTLSKDFLRWKIQ